MSAGIKIISKPLPAMIYLKDINCDCFTDQEGLEQLMWSNWQQYRATKLYINSYSWKESVNKLEIVLKEIYATSTK